MMPAGTERFHNISSVNKSTILKFCDDMVLLNLSDKTIFNYETYLKKLARFLKNKTFKGASKDDIKEFFNIMLQYSPNTQETMKITVKRFYRWLYNLEPDDKLPDSIRWIKFRTARQKRREKIIDKIDNKLLTDEEYQLLIKYAGILQYKAMIETLKWYGPRIDEFCSMNIGGVGSNDGGVYITIYISKTEPRRITLNGQEHYPQYLMDWLDCHPFRGDKNAPVWINIHKRKSVYMKRIKEQPIRDIIHKIQKKASIEKNIHPHLFRHNRITEELKNGTPIAHVSSKYAVSIETIESTYNHNNEDSYLQWIKEQNKTLEPSRNELLQEKQRLETEFERRFKQMEATFVEKMKILDSGLAAATRKNAPHKSSEGIIDDYIKLKSGIDSIILKLEAEGKSKEEIDQLKEFLTQGLQ